jgi:DNA-binding NarL/FixJ family response regulator
LSVRVLIVDDQPWVRVGLRELLGVQPGLSVVGVLESGEAVVLMDVRMPGLGGIEAARRLKAAGGPPVILLTTFEEEGDMVAGLQAGASGYLLKDSSVEGLRDAIERVARGERVVQPRVAEVLAAALERLGAGAEVHSLTPREREILVLLAQDLSNKAVAARLRLTEGTVKVHVSNILGKLGVANRSEAVRLARAAGLLPAG